MMDNPPKTEAAWFVPTLVAWFEKHGRRLPWRNAPGPYQVWVSEIMLQQTQVATVLDYYDRWMKRFPDLNSLAAAPLDDVLALWAGLGYYRRAKYLHQGARFIRDNLNGVFPSSPQELRKIIGIGEYTAGAIAAFAFHQNVPAIDGNAERVLSRFFGIFGDVHSGESQKQLKHTAHEIAALGKSYIVNQAIMDLGSGCCARTAKCSECPLADRCYALRNGLTATLPQKKARIEKTIQYCRALTLAAPNGSLLIAQRHPDGLLGNLWEFPIITVCRFKEKDAPAQEPAQMRLSSRKDWIKWCNDHQIKPEFADFSPTDVFVTHIFTHIRMHIRLDTAVLSQNPPQFQCEDETYQQFQFVLPENFHHYPMSSMMKKLLVR